MCWWEAVHAAAAWMATSGIYMGKLVPNMGVVASLPYGEPR